MIIIFMPALVAFAVIFALGLYDAVTGTDY